MYLYPKTCDICLRLKAPFMKYIIETKYVFQPLNLTLTEIV